MYTVYTVQHLRLKGGGRHYLGDGVTIAVGCCAVNSIFARVTASANPNRLTFFVSLSTLSLKDLI